MPLFLSALFLLAACKVTSGSLVPAPVPTPSPSPAPSPSPTPTPVQTTAALDSSPAALAKASTTITIGSAFLYWNAIPSDPTTYTVQEGNKLSFKYSSYHNVWLLPDEAAWTNCDFSGGIKLASTSQGGGDPDPSLFIPNLYEAVVKSPGILYFACQRDTHCKFGQKITIAVATTQYSSTASPNPTTTTTQYSGPWVTTLVRQSATFSSLAPFADTAQLTSAFATSMSGATGVPLTDLDVRITSLKVKVVYSDYPDAVSKANTKSAVALANAVSEDEVEVSSPSWRRLARSRHLNTPIIVTAEVTLDPTKGDMVVRAKQVHASVGDTSLLVARVIEVAGPAVAQYLNQVAAIGSELITAIETIAVTPESLGGNVLVDSNVVAQMQTELGAVLSTVSASIVTTTTTTTYLRVGFDAPGGLVIPWHRWSSTVKATTTSTTQNATTTFRNTTTTAVQSVEPISKAAAIAVMAIVHISIGFVFSLSL